MIRRKPRISRWALTLVAALGVLCAVLLAVAHARPGGGQGYSGGGRGGGGGGSSGGGGGGEIVLLLIRLIMVYPQVGVPVAAAVVVGYIVIQRRNAALGDWDSERSAGWQDTGTLVSTSGAPDLSAIRRFDPEFSAVLFTDFAYALYAQAHRARSDHAALTALSPYIAEPARRALAERPPIGEPVATVVIGAMRVTRLALPNRVPQPEARVDVGLYFESNITTGDGANAQTFYVVESWTLSRAASAKSRPPGKTRSFNCPNCGAPFESGDGTVCSYCGEAVANGRFDWLVEQITLAVQDPRPPTLLAQAEEQGTDRDTIYDQALDQQRTALAADDPHFDDGAFGERLQLIYQRLNEDWGKLELTSARPYVSDNLFDYLNYYVTAYQQQGLRNINDEARIERWTFVKVARDRYFDAITVRLWATGHDYTIDDRSGKVVGGSKRRTRRYSEYWTLIRSASTRGPTRVDERCPQCGAELAITMAGTCEYCQAHVTAGEFDWVLGHIEQDEAYRG